MSIQSAVPGGKPPEALAAVMNGYERQDRLLPGLRDALEDLNREYVFVCDPVGILYVPERKLYRYLDFSHVLANRCALNADNKVVPVASAWRRWSGRAECTKLVYEPAQPSGLLEDRSFNLYRGPGVEPREGDIGPWRKLLDHIFRGTPRERAWFEQWVAYALKPPGVKLFTAVVLWGEQGAGKSLAGEVIGRLYGENYYEPSHDDVAGQFNPWLRFRQFVLMNEIVSTGSRHDADRLKAMITQEYCTINEKYQPQYRVRDCVNYLLTSNHPDAVMVEDRDRRYFVHRVAQPLDGDIANELHNFKENHEGMAALLHYLLREVALEGFAPRTPVPDTPAKLEMMEATLSDVDRLVRDRIADAKNGSGPNEVTISELREHLFSETRYRAKDAQIIGALQKYAAERLIKNQRRVNGKRVRLWRLTKEVQQKPLHAACI